MKRFLEDHPGWNIHYLTSYNHAATSGAAQVICSRCEEANSVCYEHMAHLEQWYSCTRDGESR